MPNKREAMSARLQRLQEAHRVYELCDCLWPLVRMRNGDGHDDACPAHVPMGAESGSSEAPR